MLTWLMLAWCHYAPLFLIFHRWSVLICHGMQLAMQHVFILRILYTIMIFHFWLRLIYPKRESMVLFSLHSQRLFLVFRISAPCFCMIIRLMQNHWSVLSQWWKLFLFLGFISLIYMGILVLRNWLCNSKKSSFVVFLRSAFWLKWFDVDVSLSFIVSDSMQECDFAVPSSHLTPRATVSTEHAKNRRQRKTSSSIRLQKREGIANQTNARINKAEHWLTMTRKHPQRRQNNRETRQTSRLNNSHAISLFCSDSHSPRKIFQFLFVLLFSVTLSQS